ncbi:MAG: hypothetical protein IJ761_07160 [Bacteroidales bacterium]|nr:hypothetical protein [Bacteroidales bacterium]
MKKTLPFAIALLLSATLFSCSKSHQCKCVTTDIPDDGLLKIMIVDKGMSCDDIRSMAMEQKYVEDSIQTLIRTEVHDVSCRDYYSE